ncbi:hypothetical protein EUTSA_v10002696mg [Eutrema salsugineum]|uniref:Senescence regulator n=1 Tax=Eutrema salsugineum TaxID=72664 RepID=V4MYA2_EUTSA|nr:uncharacterized protein LOC18013537 [Eutrema salsugineum]ESQ37496.1 hypothetical protein EUTSA_v10002696mg [Eutrema salsugineum]
MATGKTYYPRPSHRFLPTDRSHQVAVTDSGFEFDESDLYSDSHDFRSKLFKSGRIGIKQCGRSSLVTVTTAKVGSLPMNVPDQSKNCHRRRTSIEIDEDGLIDGGDRLDGGRFPPHEYLARTRIASFSVHEGVGRTLKGRDLSRVRNAIFKKTGVLD